MSLYAAQRLWNNLPLAMLATEYNSFEMQLQTILLKLDMFFLNVCACYAGNVLMPFLLFTLNLFNFITIHF